MSTDKKEKTINDEIVNESGEGLLFEEDYHWSTNSNSYEHHFGACVSKKAEFANRHRQRPLS